MAATGGDGLRVAVVGASGLVGDQIVDLLSERNFPFAELFLFASQAGRSAEVTEGEIPINELADPADLDVFDIVFIAVPPGVADDIARYRPKGLTVDLSSAGQLPSNRPIVAPGLTSRDQVASLTTGIVGIAHPAAAAIATLLSTLGAENATATIQASASWSGHDHLAELVDQTAALLNTRLELDEEERQLAFNIYTEAADAALASALSAQVGRLVKSSELPIQIFRTPVFHGTIITLHIPGTFDTAAASESLRAAPGVLLIEQDDFPGVMDVAGDESLLVRVGASPAGLSLWCLLDNVRRAALSAVWVAECRLPSGRSAMN